MEELVGHVLESIQASLNAGLHGSQLGTPAPGSVGIVGIADLLIELGTLRERLKHFESTVAVKLEASPEEQRKVHHAAPTHEGPPLPAFSRSDRLQVFYHTVRCPKCGRWLKLSHRVRVCLCGLDYSNLPLEIRATKAFPN